MKTIFIIIISIFFISTCYAQKDLLPAYPREISYSGDIAYFNGSPFTGILVEEKTNKKIGEFINGYKNGVFTDYYTNGNKKSECEYVNGQKDGTCTEWFENKQQKSSYDFNNGNILDGKYVSYLEEGQKDTETTYKNGQIILSGKYENDKLIVLLELSVELYPNGQKKSEGFIKIGKKEELWTFWYQQGQKKSEGYYKNGNQEGIWVSWFENGEKEFEGNYKNGHEEGQWTTWFENGGKEFEGSYVNGQKDGYCTLTLSDGTRYQGEWKNGEMNGKGSSYSVSEDGKITRTYTGYFVNGAKEGQGTLTGVYKAAWGISPFSFTGEWKNGTMYNGIFYDTTNLGKSASEYRNGKLVQTRYLR